MTGGTLPEGTPILCRQCGGHMQLAAEGTVTCPFCGARDVLPADELGRALEIKRRLADAERRAAHVRGFDGALAGAFEDRMAFVRVMGVYVVLGGLLLAASLVNLVTMVLPNLGEASFGTIIEIVVGQALAPIIVLGIGLSLGVALFAGRVYYRRRVRPLLVARPPSQAGAPFACRVCGGGLPAARSTSVTCRYCNATNLTPRELHGRLAENLSREADDARRQLHQANVATMSIGGVMQRTAFGCGLLALLVGGGFWLLLRVLFG